MQRLPRFKQRLRPQLESLERSRMSVQVVVRRRGMSKRNLRWAAIGIAASLLSGCGTPEQINGANWSGSLESARGREFTPERAIRRQISGWALLSCAAGENLSVKDCVVFGEYPQSQGFGDAALRMQSNLKAQDATQFGGHQPKPGERLLFPISFCQPDREAECAQIKTDREAYRQKLIMIEEFVQAGRCDAAQEAAAETGQPLIMPVVAKACATHSSVTN